MIDSTEQIIEVDEALKSAKTGREHKLRETWEVGDPITNHDQYRIARAVLKRFRRACHEGVEAPDMRGVCETIRFRMKEFVAANEEK
jgi:hypothetical protein